VENVFEEEGNKLNEEDLPELYPRKEEDKKDFNKHNDVYKVDKMEDIVGFFDRNCRKFRNTLIADSTNIELFNSYRNILDMEQFSEKNNTLIFWRDYIKQLWAMSPAAGKERIWLMLNDLLAYSFNSQNDTLILLLTMKELADPFLPPEQLRMLCKKIAMFYPLAQIHFLESYLEKGLEKHPHVAADSVYYCMSDALEELGEKDLLLGYRKTKLEKERDKNMLSMLQLREYQAAEELCEEIMSDTEIIVPTKETLKGYIEKHIYEESWIEIQKNCNEWNSLYELAKETERKDLMYEAAYFTERIDTVANLFNNCIVDEDSSAVNYVYYITSRLMVEKDRTELTENRQVKQTKEPIYLMLIKGWYYVPEVFSQMHINHLSVSHFCIEFEEAFDIILDNYQNKKLAEPKNIGKLKDDITYINLICRQRIPDPSEGILNCKRIFQQRSIISNVLYQRIDYLMDQKTGVNLSSNVTEERSLSIFNETNHNAIMYCKVERQYDLYNSLINLRKKELDRVCDEKILSTQTDEYYYYHELLKLWEYDENEMDPPQKILDRMSQESFNKDFRSDLHGAVMNGYMSKNMVEEANRHGIEGLRLNEENWKIWRYWFLFYKKLYHSFATTDKNLQYFNQMLKAYVKAIKYKPTKTLLLFTDILNVLYFRDDIRGKAGDEQAKQEVLQSFRLILTDTPVWTWALWLGNLLVSVYKKNSLRLDREFIEEALAIASKNYNSYVYFILNNILNSNSIKDDVLKAAFERCKNNPLATIKLQETNIGKLHYLFAANLDTINEHQETISQLYCQEQIDSRRINEINAKMRNIGDGYNLFKNQDSSQKLQGIIKSLNEYIASQKTSIQNKPSSGMEPLPLGLKFVVPNSFYHYSEKNLGEFFLDGFLLPDIKIVCEGRRFKLYVEFFTSKYKKMSFTVEKNNVDPINLMSYNHYLKLLNVEMMKNNETIYRGIKFEMMDMIYLDLEDDFCLKAKPITELYLIDMLDAEMEALGEKTDCALEMFALKKNTVEVNKSMMEGVSGKILKKEITRRLNNEFDMFLWKKKYAYSLGVNMINSMIFFKEHNFEKLRIVLKTAEFYDDNMNFKIDMHQKAKPQAKFPLRFTQNNKELLQEYFLEGALYPAIGAVGKALYNGCSDLSYSSILQLFVKDFHYNSVEDRGLVYKFIEQTIENHYNSFLKMTMTHESAAGKNTRNLAFTSLRAFVENISNEDTIKTYPLSFRSWF
jgi:hypothetical protein